MRKPYALSKEIGIVCTWVLPLFLAVAFSGPAMAYDFEFAGRPGMLSGYINQSVQFGIAGDHYDTREGFQAAIFQFLLEIKHKPYSNVRVFFSTNFNANWVYPILEHDDAWREKEFNRSRSNYYILDDYATLLKEAHVSWSPGDFIFRLGKQIVVWGETDGVRLMDQINPVDTRRGISDVEFETTIIPIWLLKSEYYPSISSSWLQDLGFEFVFNPNADFIADKGFSTGNDVHGIWSPNIIGPDYYDIPLLAPLGFQYIPTDIRELLPPPLQNIFDTFPTLHSRLGALTQDLEKPDQWDPDYMEYGLRLRSVIYDTIITLNGFYGRENSPVVRSLAELPPVRMASDGLLILEPTVEGFYPRFRFAGFTVSRDFEKLQIRALGGVAPVLRIEALYAYNSTFVTNGKVGVSDLLAGKTEAFEEHDEIRYSIGIDWKVRIRWLNPRDSIMVNPQFIQQHIIDYPSDYGLIAAGSLPKAKNNYTTTLMLRTTYFHNKLIPLLFWQHEIQGAQDGNGSVNGDLVLVQLSYEQSYHWNYTLQAVFIQGEAMQPLAHKDNLTFTVAYRF